MFNSEKYEQELLKALTHLDNPDYQPTNLLYELIGLNTEDNALLFKIALLRAIEDLKLSTDNTPPISHDRLHYDLLYKRFVQKLTQKETAEQLHVSRTSIYRLQLKAIHTLARELWKRSHSVEIIPDDKIDLEVNDRLNNEQSNNRVNNWNLQVQNEIASLERSVPKVGLTPKKWTRKKGESGTL